MGYITQSNSPVSDAFTFTFSTWFNISSNNPPIITGADRLNIFELAVVPEAPDFSSPFSSIGIRYDVTQNPQWFEVDVFFDGPTVTIGSGSGANTFSPYFGATTSNGQLDSPGAPPTVGSFALALDHWHHLFISCDSSSDDILMHAGTFTFIKNKIINIYLDNANLLSAPLITTVTSEGPVSGMLSDITSNTDMHWEYFNGSPGFAGDGGPPPLPGTTAPAPMHEISVTGCDIGMPSVSIDEVGNKQVRFAYTQAWFGNYIDPNPTNLSKFFTIVPGGIRPPNNVLAAQQYFGPSDIYFYRDKTLGIKYQDNHGIAGPFSVVGTAPADYTPGPGQAGTPGDSRLRLGDSIFYART